MKGCIVLMLNKRTKRILSKIKRRMSLEAKLEEVKWSNSVSMAANLCNRETFLPLKNICNGEKLVICGAGPSLAKYQPIEDAKHIALNRALLFDRIKYDYFFADDWPAISFFSDKIVKYDCEKFLGYICGYTGPACIPESFRISSGAKKFYLDSYMTNSARSQLVLDIDKMPISNQYNMGLEIMQIALFMNPSKIYLVGIDANSNGHFTEKGLSNDTVAWLNKGQKRYIDFESVKDKWNEIKTFAEAYYPETEIISINPVGLKGLFKDEYC